VSQDGQRVSIAVGLLQAARQFGRDGCFNHAAAISYFALLSIVPFLGLLTWVMSAFVGTSEEAIEAALARLQALIPTLEPPIIAGARQLLESGAALGWASLGATIWMSSFVFMAVQTAVSQIFHQTASPRGWRAMALSTLWEMVRPFLLFVAATLLLVATFVLENVVAFLQGAAPQLAQQLLDFFGSLPPVGFVISFAVSTAVFAVIIQVLTRRWLRPRALLTAAVTGAVGWELAKNLFAAYVGYLSANLTFQGSAAAAVLFMIWIYYAAGILLYSVEVAAALRE